MVLDTLERTVLVVLFVIRVIAALRMYIFCHVIYQNGVLD